MIQRVEEILFDGMKSLTEKADCTDKDRAFVKVCAMSLRSVLVAMGERDPDSTKEVMQLFQDGCFCQECGKYLGKDGLRCSH